MTNAPTAGDMKNSVSQPDVGEQADRAPAPDQSERREAVNAMGITYIAPDFDARDLAIERMFGLRD